MTNSDTVLLYLYVMVGSLTGFQLADRHVTSYLAEICKTSCVEKSCLCSLVVAEMHGAVEDSKDALHKYRMRDFHSH